MSLSPYVDALLSPYVHHERYDTTQATPEAHGHPTQDLVPVRTRHTRASGAQPQGTGDVRSRDQATTSGDVVQRCGGTQGSHRG